MAPLVEFAGVAFGYPRPALSREGGFSLTDVSFAIEPGEIFGVIGPNSAGKTTLLRLLTRVVSADRGEIRLAGRAIAPMAHAELARQVAVVPQDTPRPFPFTVEQLVLMGRYPHGPGRFFENDEDRALARAAMAATGVLDLADLPLEQLAGGERQRATLARALAQQPQLLVLDEPTSHLDLRYQLQTAALLRQVNAEQGTTVLLVSHDLDLAAEVCDRLLLLEAGRIARIGPPKTVLQKDVLERVFRCPVAVDVNPTSGRPLVRVAWPSVSGAARGG
ncbi:MAG TPA: ABC transporter ATP-binding protein [Patescibacteria group bacterium]|nr:ABC transporter ATP-binding protein [Patescibacteria group bacterium]